MDVLKHAATVPILGVCLGHQVCPRPISRGSSLGHVMCWGDGWLGKVAERRAPLLCRDAARRWPRRMAAAWCMRRSRCMGG